MRELYVIIDNVRSAYNVGSIFRSADGAGIKKIFVCGISPTPENLKVKKTALGSTESIEWAYFKTTEEAVALMKEEGIPVWAIEITPDSKHFQKEQYPDSLAIILGHETEGVHKHILDMCDNSVFIPMRGKKESLNVATTAGIIMYEIMRE